MISLHQPVGDVPVQLIDGFVLQCLLDGTIRNPNRHALFPCRYRISLKHAEKLDTLNQRFVELSNGDQNFTGFNGFVYNERDIP